ncbi:MAG: hypothetical protein ACFFCY_09365 [Promethearchaeota archaeon]
MTEKVWEIRVSIQKLEDIKDEIIQHLSLLKKLDDSTRSIWVSDVKEFYYNIVSAWEMLRSSSNLEFKEIQKSKNFLYVARNQLSKIISELNIFQNNFSIKLIEEVENAFNECWEAFFHMFKSVEIEMLAPKPSEMVITVSDLEYHLPCAVCGKIAVEFKIGYGRFDEKEALVFRGITHERSLSIKLAFEVFEKLIKRDLPGIHNFMKEYHSYEGLDAYCPECNKIYCWEHYDAKEEYDDGFYDCTYGVCPNGHKRMIDD